VETGQEQPVQKTFSRASYRQRLIATLVFFAIAGTFTALWVIGHYNITLWPFVCGFRQLYGLPCPTCGYTTSVMAFAQGQVIRSFYIQPAAALFCTLAVAAAFFAFLVAVFGVYSPAFERRIVTLKLWYIFAAIVLVVAVGWIVTFARAIR
jgi:hypothetical protein